MSIAAVARIGVDGPDALKFLNDLVTQDLADLAEGACAYAALLTAQGKVIADFLVWRTSGGYALDVAEARADALERRMRLYKLRAAVTIERLAPAPGDAPACVDPRLPALGTRSPGGPAPTLDTRLAAGVPDLAVDAAPEEVFGLEALLEELKGVSFTKGCFVGQENISRMKRRATTRRKFCPVAFEGQAPAYGTRVRAGNADLGDIRSAMPGRALALLRLDRAQEAIAAGETLHADGLALALAPPDWLILPPAKSDAED
jgi:hypothetical protein